jgi:hypothetical protein
MAMTEGAHPQNANSPIDWSRDPASNVTHARAAAPRNAPRAIATTEAGIAIALIALWENVDSAIRSNLEPGSNPTVSRERQARKAARPTTDTDAGKISVVRELPAKADPSMRSKSAGNWKENAPHRAKLERPKTEIPAGITTDGPLPR